MLQGTGGEERQAGVTLVELVVALAVIALTLAAAANSLWLLGRSGDRGAHLIAQHDMLSRGVDALRHDIERLERVVRRRENDAEFVFQGDEKGLALVLVEPPIPSEAGPYLVVYSIEQREAGGALVRSRAPLDGAAKDIRRLRSQDEVTVLEGPYNFQFYYFERKNGQERWVSRWIERSRIPALIKLEIRGIGAGVAGLPPLVFRPRVDAELGCIKEGGALCTLRTGGALTAQPAAMPERKN
jgi:general secretion pathway protein J